ncbi:MAG TPA: hypothetical protein VMX35_13700 [Acidobacteriota bacterium]|nr:hypothetical protein [Acidobacteriota bacterium]
MKRTAMTAACAVLLAILLAAAPDITEDERAAELERVNKMAEEILPKVMEVTGIEKSEPVKIVITTRAEVRDFVVKLMEEEYPGDELERQSRVFAALGLLPEGFDLRKGLIDLLHEQAGAFYDPRTKAYYSIIDLPKELKIPIIERVLVAHELTHALQDRVVDLLALQQQAKDNTDLGYANTSVMEGMASVTMFVAGQGMQLKSLPDIGGLMRMSMGSAASNPMMQVFAASPQYLQETLISPYAEGASFMQAYIKANPEAKPITIFERMPESSEQILHYAKFAEGDSPTAIDLSSIDPALPEKWRPFYGNVLGEFDIKVLCQLHDSTKETAEETAAGWDGIHFRAFVDSADKLIILGASVWDSETDAAEFAEALEQVLIQIHGESNVAVAQSADRVEFIVGEVTAETRTAALKALAAASATVGSQP